MFLWCKGNHFDDGKNYLLAIFNCEKSCCIARENCTNFCPTMRLSCAQPVFSFLKKWILSIFLGNLSANLCRFLDDRYRHCLLNAITKPFQCFSTTSKHCCSTVTMLYYIFMVILLNKYKVIEIDDIWNRRQHFNNVLFVTGSGKDP